MAALGYAQSPLISALDPPSVAAGSSDFTLHVSGSGFTAASVVHLNGSARSTQLLASDPDHPGVQTLAATITAADVAAYSEARITVADGTAESAPAFFTIYAVIQVRARDIVFEPFRRRLYASIASDSPVFANDILPVLPETATTDTPIKVGIDPGRLTVSSLGKAIYAGFAADSSLRRLNAKSQSLNLIIKLPADAGLTGNVEVQDLAIIPGTDSAIAVARRQSTTNVGVAVYDDDIKRTAGLDRGVSVAPSSIAFTDAAHLFADSNFSRITVDASGLTLLDQTPLLVLSPNGLVSDGALLYSANGYVVDPVQKAIVANFSDPSQPPLQGQPPLQAASLALDKSLNRIAFLSPQSGGSYIQVFALADHSMLGRITLPGITPGGSLFRFGRDGLAFRDSSGNLYLLRTSLLVPPSAGEPVLSSLSPGQVVMGDDNFLLSLSGSEFAPGATVQWNG